MTDKPRWNPAEQPYRLTRVRQSSQVGCYGWAYCAPQMYATEAEALAAMAAPMAAGVFKHSVDKARLSADGKLIGWQPVDSRKRRR